MLVFGMECGMLICGSRQVSHHPLSLLKLASKKVHFFPASADVSRRSKQGQHITLPIKIRYIEKGANILQSSPKPPVPRPQPATPSKDRCQ